MSGKGTARTASAGAAEEHALHEGQVWLQPFGVGLELEGGAAVGAAGATSGVARLGGGGTLGKDCATAFPATQINATAPNINITGSNTVVVQGDGRVTIQSQSVVQIHAPQVDIRNESGDE